MARTRTAPTIEFFWAEPDPEIVSQQILQLSYALEDFRAPLAVAAQYSREDIKRRFQTGTDPSGRPWEEWSDNYEPWALRHTTGPILPGRANLHLTGEMEDQVLDPGNWRVTGGDVFFDTSGVDDKWAWNNFGTETDRNAGKKDPSGFEYEPNDLPPRPFIGMSPVTRAKIETAFEAWFAGEVAAATSIRGKAFFRHAKRGAGGRFAR